MVGTLRFAHPTKRRQNGLMEKYRSHKSVKRPFSQIRNSAQFSDVRSRSLPLRTPMPMPSPKKRLSTKGPPENAQHSAESVPLIQKASEMPSPKMKSTSPRRSASRSASSFG